jgi:hypothetical protein
MMRRWSEMVWTDIGKWRKWTFFRENHVSAFSWEFTLISVRRCSLEAALDVGVKALNLRRLLAAADVDRDGHDPRKSVEMRGGLGRSRCGSKCHAEIRWMSVGFDLTARPSRYLVARSILMDEIGEPRRRR